MIEMRELKLDVKYTNSQKELWPLNRSITGDGVRQTLERFYKVSFTRTTN